MPIWRSCTCAWVQASVAARTKAFASWCLSTRSSNAARDVADAGPERNAHGGARGYAHAITKREHRIKHRADGVGQASSVHHGDGFPNVAPAAEEARPIGLNFRFAQGLAFDDRVMGGPDFRIGRRAPSPRRQDRAHLRRILGLHEEL